MNQPLVASMLSKLKAGPMQQMINAVKILSSVLDGGTLSVMLEEVIADKLSRQGETASNRLPLLAA
ncbi:MAG: hypothetical protein V7542_10925 [Limnobacter sp.]|uniref:hypothetical protein n=1 Tax=unclassified Limnobacter TaxID=2630203 RepID=UPI0011B0823F|nr:hypothetical protein [Limnobacter sp. SAORIC-690]